VTGVLSWVSYRPSFFPSTPIGTAPGEVTGFAAVLQSPYLRAFMPFLVLVALASLV